ncbi:DUF4829 domain-containing protein [Clostridium sp. Sa3CUN1]|uniref:DUF4829 domain-containing protein n=1 Tax=Clostridium gallinarum TaxID=2762246 RepID=A0ABR8Q464_9CLOT|nr:DUF4829 domain-containing protein [Clostridium gallinarum]MBD7915210.1 DUF4829 domain-containing protein [Clostridium gallinarum]
MNKKLKIILISIVFILSVFFIFIKTINSPERTIKNYIESIDTHNIDRLNKCVTYDNRLGAEGIDTIKNAIESMKLINVELVNDESIYSSYIQGKSKSFKDELPRDDIKIYKVKYYIKYKDDNKSVKDSGEYTQTYYLIKESYSKKWKINDIGD